MSSTPNRRSSEHLELIFEVYALIPTTRKITVTEIHQALSDKGIIRAKRTIQRCLDSLLSYFEIEQDTRSQPYGYRRKVMTKLTFSPRDHMMLSWSEASLKALLPDDHQEFIEAAFIPIKAPGQHNLPIDIRIEKSTRYLVGDKLVFETLCLAVFYKREVRLTVTETMTRLYIRPLGFIVENFGRDSNMENSC